MNDSELEKLASLISRKIMPKIERIIEGKMNERADSHDELITQNQLAELLGVHPSTLHGKTDIYPSVMVGGRKRFLKHKVMSMLVNQ